MVQKRPLVEEEVSNSSNKHLRQTQLDSYSESVHPEDASQMSNASGEGRFIKTNIRCDEKIASIIDAEEPGSAGDIEANVPGCVSMSSWATSSTSEEDSGPDEPPLHVPFVSECLNPERPIRTLAHWEDIYSLLLGYPPRKAVPVGPNHQADIPEWDSQVSKKTYDVGAPEDVYEKLLMGTCIIPMPDFEPSPFNGNMVGKGRTDCSCEDKFSVRCLRQHIMEAREELRKSIGHEAFVELGFCEMGEIVSKRWSEEEEQLFHKVVFSNPVSLGRHFWENLSAVFPYRTKQEIVSYYFNVFMLRKRTEQNRCESMSIDSDNDEWQGIDDSGNSEGEMSDEDEDSVVESPAYGEDFGHHQIHENGLHVFDEDIADETCDNDEDVGLGNGTGPEIYSMKHGNCYGSDPTDKIQGKISFDEREQEAQDDSCTSSEKGVASQENQVNPDHGDHWAGSFNGLSSDGGHAYVLEPCDAKVWDSGSGYSTCQRNKIDFLPTCSMIEEVFGDGSWNYKARDGKSLS